VIVFKLFINIYVTVAQLPQLKQEINQKSVVQAKKLNDQGNKAYKSSYYQVSVEMYTKALELPDLSYQERAILYSNRSAARIRIGTRESLSMTLEDAKKVKSLSPALQKAYYREGIARHHLLQYEKAVKAFENGLAIDPMNEELIKARAGLRMESNKDVNICT